MVQHINSEQKLVTLALGGVIQSITTQMHHIQHQTTEATNIWQLTLQDLNTQFPIRTAALDDIDGLESNVVSDMLMEFSQQEGLSMIQNDDQVASSNSTPYGGSNGLRGLNQYPGANASYTGGQTSVSAYGSSGTGSSSGLHDDCYIRSINNKWQYRC